MLKLFALTDYVFKDEPGIYDNIVWFILTAPSVYGPLICLAVGIFVPLYILGIRRLKKKRQTVPKNQRVLLIIACAFIAIVSTYSLPRIALTITHNIRQTPHKLSVDYDTYKLKEEAGDYKLVKENIVKINPFRDSTMYQTQYEQSPGRWIWVRSGKKIAENLSEEKCKLSEDLSVSLEESSHIQGYDGKCQKVITFGHSNWYKISSDEKEEYSGIIAVQNIGNTTVLINYSYGSGLKDENISKIFDNLKKFNVRTSVFKYGDPCPWPSPMPHCDTATGI